jgi:hypothetical protein
LTSKAGPSGSHAATVLQSLLTDSIPSLSSSQRLIELETIVGKDFPTSFPFVYDLTKAYDAKATKTRSANDQARRQRQEASEAHTDDLFNANEIAYADIKELEDEFKQQEAERQAKEDREDYEVYVKEVFEPVYGKLQSEIGSLMEIDMEVGGLAHHSVAGKEALLHRNPSSKATGTLQALRIFRVIRNAIEARHAAVVTAVAERDKRYKKTEVQPLYAANQIAKMKSVEKHFEQAEKNALLKAAEDRLQRLTGFQGLFEDVTARAVSDNDAFRAEVVGAVEDIVPDSSTTESLGKAKTVLDILAADSKALMQLLGEVETEMVQANFEVALSRARTNPAGIDPKTVQEIEQERTAELERVKTETQDRLTVLAEDERTATQLFASGEGKEREQRLQAALEEARRRNGEREGGVKLG